MCGKMFDGVFDWLLHHLRWCTRDFFVAGFAACGCKASNKITDR